jgi:uncharacterized membrane protein
MSSSARDGAPAARDAAPGITAPGIVLGVGLGGFVDGILLHQVLQWHHLLSSTDTDRVGIPTYSVDTVHGLRINTLGDGLFHTFTWLAVLIGLGLLHSRWQRAHGRLWTSRALWGHVLSGWGLFNLVEGLVDHQLLGIHHVRSGPHEVAWDVGFLALGVLLLVGGRLLARTARPAGPGGRG